MDYAALGVAGALACALIAIWSRRYFHDHGGDREKWKALKLRLSESDLEDLEYYTYQARAVPLDLMEKLRVFADDLEEDREDVRFSARKEPRLRQCKEKFVKAYRAYREFVSVPYWDIDDNERWRLQKRWLIEQGSDYAEHLRLACEEIDAMRKAYRELHDRVYRW